MSFFDYYCTEDIRGEAQAGVSKIRRSSKACGGIRALVHGPKPTQCSPTQCPPTIICGPSLENSLDEQGLQGAHPHPQPCPTALWEVRCLGFAVCE
jgi:hypothetical protein